MIITQYHIKKIHTGLLLDLPDWSIRLTIEPTWFDRIFMARCFPETRTLFGNYNSWKWTDENLQVGFFWRWWANAVLARHDKTKEEATYVNCSIIQ
jgi:hypothetical protein